MSRSLDRQGLLDKAAAIRRHLELVAQSLPDGPLEPNTPTTAMVVLHLFQAVQLTVDIALAACARLKLATPPSYGAAFQTLAQHGALDPALAKRLVAASGFRNAVAHAYESLDLPRVHRAAYQGPADLQAFLAAIAPIFGE